VKEIIKAIIKAHHGKSQTELIKNLNPIITGWTNYHSNICAKKIFAQIDNYIFLKLWKWAKRRHSNKSREWIKNRYWQRILFRDGIFSDGNTQLKQASHTKIIRHRIIKFDANPYLPQYQRYYYYRDKQRMQERNNNVAANGIFGE
jgi:RNA-directed DNA polymerase